MDGRAVGNPIKGFPFFTFSEMSLGMKPGGWYRHDLAHIERRRERPFFVLKDQEGRAGRPVDGRSVGNPIKGFPFFTFSEILLGAQPGGSRRHAWAFGSAAGELVPS